MGCEDGFLENGLLLFPSNKTGDYHEEMNADLFENWFEKILPDLEHNSVVVLDNASYHSRKLEKIPNSSMKKCYVQEWLTKNNIRFDQNMLKVELLSLVKQHKPKYDQYVVDNLAKSKSKTVLRLPPYHCELNPIELIWAQVKGEVARNNTTFKLKDVQNLLHAAIQNVTKENWVKAIDHVRSIETKMWEVDEIQENLEEFIINVGDSSTSDDSSSE